MLSIAQRHLHGLLLHSSSLIECHNFVGPVPPTESHHGCSECSQMLTKQLAGRVHTAAKNAISFFMSLCLPACLSVRIYRVIHKSLRDFLPLRYSTRDGHAEGEHVNRGRDTSSFCPTLQVIKLLPHTLLVCGSNLITGLTSGG